MHRICTPRTIINTTVLNYDQCCHAWFHYILDINTYLQVHNDIYRTLTMILQWFLRCLPCVISSVHLTLYTDLVSFAFSAIPIFLCHRIFFYLYIYICNIYTYVYVLYLTVIGIKWLAETCDDGLHYWHKDILKEWWYPLLVLCYQLVYKGYKLLNLLGLSEYMYT